MRFIWWRWRQQLQLDDYHRNEHNTNNIIDDYDDDNDDQDDDDYECDEFDNYWNSILLGIHLYSYINLKWLASLPFTKYLSDFHVSR